MNKKITISIMLIVLMSAGIAQASLLDDLRNTLMKFAKTADITYPSVQPQCTESQLSGLRSWVDNNVPITSGLQEGKNIIHLSAGTLGFPCTTSTDVGYYENYMHSYWEYKYNSQQQYTPPPIVNTPPPPVNTQPEGPLPTIEQPRYTPPPEIIPEPIADVIGIEQSPGFDSGLAILGLLITALLVLRRR